MLTYKKFQIDETTSVLIEVPQPSGGLTQASRGGDAIKEATKSLGEAWKGIRAQANALIQELESMPVSEAEIKFGVSTTAEADFVVSKLGVGVNYEVTLKWKKPETK